MKTPVLLLLGLGFLGCTDKSDPILDDTGPVSTDDTGDTDDTDDTDDPVDADGDGFDEDVDCDDADPQVNPEATEVCDGADNDCDGLIDLDDDSLDASTKVLLYVDADGDGYGDAALTQEACEAGDGLVADDTDCDDTNVDRFPGNPEVCDGVDNDCDDDVDDIDADGDGFLDASCDGDDCDDADAAVNPDATEVCDDGIDNDCDGSPGVCLPTGDISLGDSDAIFVGEAAGDRAAQGDPGVASAGDVNGDGFGDIIVGAIRNDAAGADAGAAYIVYGPASGEISLSDANVKITGANEGDYLGRSVNGVGDTNNDGYDDVLVNALYNSDTAYRAGATYLFHAPLSASISADDAHLTLLGEAEDDQLADVDRLGDTNGDGYADLLLTAQFNDTNGSNAGAAYVVLSPASGTVNLGSSSVVRLDGDSGEEFGSAVGAGDFNGDGLADALVGARYADANGTDSGSVYLFEGPLTVSGTFADADAVFTGEEADDQLGNFAGVSSAGDVNDDGNEDIILGARNNDTAGSDRGAVYLMLGPISSGTRSVATADTIFRGEANSYLMGESSDGLGDFDGDGVGDLIIGSGFADAGTDNGGAAYLVLGPPPTGTVDMTSAQARYVAEADNDRIRVQGGGDIDGDGQGDILVGAQLSDRGGADSGAAYLIYGTGL